MTYLEQLQSQVKKGTDVFIAPNAYVLGNVTLGNRVSIWYGATLRADFDSIVIGDDSNVQEGVIMHVDHGTPLTVGKSVTVGHGAVLHGCTVGDNSLIGIKAVVLNGAVIGKGCVIGANALIKENDVIPDFSLVVGSPGKVIRQLGEETMSMLQLSAQVYAEEASKYLK
jgi:carbonic anhydrase/acetyltransferase-like protein (isoleucine patch superfamily)